MAKQTTTTPAPANKGATHITAKQSAAVKNGTAKAPIQMQMQGLRPTATRGFYAVRALVAANFTATFINVEKDSTGGPTPVAMHKLQGGVVNTSEDVFHGKYGVHAINALLLTKGVKVTYNGHPVQGIWPKGMAPAPAPATAPAKAPATA